MEVFMKNSHKLILALLVIALATIACGGYNGIPGDTCEKAFNFMRYDPPMTDTEIAYIALNNVWAPDSVGYTIQQCILGGWDEYDH